MNYKNVKIAEGARIAKQSVILGDVTIGRDSCVLYYAVILDGAKIGNDCIIGAGSLVTKNTVIPDGSLVMGSPARIKRNLTWEEKLGIVENSKEYLAVSEEMKEQDVLL